jgi:hypothetical protein
MKFDDLARALGATPMPVEQGGGFNLPKLTIDEVRQRGGASAVRRNRNIVMITMAVDEGEAIIIAQPDAIDVLLGGWLFLTTREGT